MEYTISLSSQEHAAGAMHPNHQKMAKHFFQVHGFVKIENAFPTALLQALLQEHTEQLSWHPEKQTLEVGTNAHHRRYIIPIALAGVFNDPRLYANPLLIPLLEDLLGPHHILHSLGSITTLPGCTTQHLHADYYPLFEENISLSQQLPPFAITFAVPLVDIDPLNGPTEIYPGSHLVYPIDQHMHTYQKQLLYGPLGCCYLWDYRTFHAGGSNHSENIRPLLYLAYTRRWFHDFANPERLIISPEEWKKIPEKHHKLFFHKKP